MADRVLLRPNEVAEIIGLGRSKAYQLIRRGEIPSVRIGCSVRVHTRVLEEWINKQVEASQQTAAPK